MRPILVLAALMAAAASPNARAAGLAINHEVLPPGTTVQACVERGRQAIGASGLRQLDNTATAAWGEGFTTPGGPADTLYSVYCTPDGRYAFFVGGAERADQVNPTVTNIINNFRAAGRGPAPSSGGMRK